MIEEKKENAKVESMEERRQEELINNLISCLRYTGRFCKIYWKIIFALLWPLFLLPFLLIYNYSEVRCAFVILTMGGYWVTDCFPMAVTALIPVVMFPALGILSTADVCTCYMNDTIMVFIGGLILAIAIEHSNLHLRIALGVMKTVGCSHAKLLGGLSVVTTFISMWVSNTAATAMMVPIIFAVLRELEQAGLGAIFKTEVDPERPDLPPEIRPTKLTRAYLLTAAYCSTFGGTGTIVGTGTNLTFKGIYESTFPEAEGISFTDWMIASFPQMVVNSFLTWLYVRIAFLGYLRPHSKDAQLATIGREGQEITNQVIQGRYKNLGPLTFHESGVAILFFLCVFLWIFRKPGFVVGWSELVTDIDLRDSVPVIMVSILMFFIPKDPSFIYSYSQDRKKSGSYINFFFMTLFTFMSMFTIAIFAATKRPKKSSEGLITWKVIETKMPWSLMFLLGGGFAISKGSVASCMAKRVGEALVPLRFLPPIVILAVVCFFEGFITEFTSNVGVANITLPVIAQMCVAMEIHPMYLMVPAALMCSFSFRLPVGTPPNAIITIAGHIPTSWLIAGGCAPAIYSLIVEVIFFPTWGVFAFGIKEFPDWARYVELDNNTDVC